MAGDPTFGERMAEARRQRGVAWGGRKKIADKHRKAVATVEQVFATAAPDIAQTYIEELQIKDPEQCPEHSKVLRCPEQGCNHRSQRTMFDHKAAAYALDRIMGKPTTRSENVVTVRLVQELTAAFVTAFVEVNDIADARSRHEAFAGRLAAIGADYGGTEAA